MVIQYSGKISFGTCKTFAWIKLRFELVRYSFSFVFLLNYAKNNKLHWRISLECSRSIDNRLEKDWETTCNRRNKRNLHFSMQFVVCSLISILNLEQQQNKYKITKIISKEWKDRGENGQKCSYFHFYFRYLHLIFASFILRKYAKNQKRKQKWKEKRRREERRERKEGRNGWKRTTIQNGCMQYSRLDFSFSHLLLLVGWFQSFRLLGRFFMIFCFKVSS